MSSRTDVPSRSAGSRPTDGLQRLQKILAAAGVGSRRHCEELIQAGRVEVDRRVVTELGTKADLAQQDVRVDGVPLAQSPRVYYLVHKPPGVVSTNNDPSGRFRVVDLVGSPQRLFTVGRLDMSSEGLILVTNDGELANRLTHPRYGVEKTYQVEVAGSLEREALERIRRGVHLAEGFARVVSIKIKSRYKNSTLLEIVLKEGRNREIRRLLARVGHKVERLKRTVIGPLRLGELPLGHVRALDRDEVRRLRQAAYGEKPQAAPCPKRAPRAKPAPTRTPRRAIIGGDSSKSSPPAARPRKAAGSAKHPRKAVRRRTAGQSVGPRSGR